MTKECDSSEEEQPQVAALRRNLEKLNFEMNSVNEGIQSYILGRRMNGSWGPSRYLIGGEENVSESDDGDEDDDAKSLFQCPFCDFEFDFSSVRARLEEEGYYDLKDMTCPLCDENLGEGAIKVAQNSSKRSWKSDKSSISSGDSVVFDKKLPARGRHEPVPDPLLSPFVRNVSLFPNSSGIQPGEGFSSSASDISNGKGSGTDSGDEEDSEERRQKVSFVQELVFSTLF
ncbi:protein DEHYDRATION-INDUCED 19 homolog 6-like isoform X2 [Phaseolus vulgaris]|uniref:protein DEHYDRATION-INDUCED 19 homolog 6-like isoform X2 n=1 Tax=Phaseolus vulgaris TaxID=3885 RepID=UPI0035CC7098